MAKKLEKKKTIANLGQRECRSWAGVELAIGKLRMRAMMAIDHNLVEEQS